MLNSILVNMNQMSKKNPQGTKPVIDVHKVKVIKNDMNQELKMKGRKLNLRFKDFAQNKKTMLENNMNSRGMTYQSEEKPNKSCFLQVKTNCEYSNEISSVDPVNYSTNSMVVHPKKKTEKMPTSLFNINQRRFQK